jgi:phytoene desaturase
VKRVCVIGAGLGGLALAIRLQVAGHETMIVEARERVGGLAYCWERKGFTFDAGPTSLADPASLRELWQLAGQDMADDVELLPVMPFFRLNWPDGTNFDYSNDEAALRREIARLAPEDLAGYDDFLRYSAEACQKAFYGLAQQPLPDYRSMVRSLPQLAGLQAWRSMRSIVASYVEHPKLREALSFPTLLVGGNPASTSAVYALIHRLEKDGGLWWAKGGTNRLVAAMAALFERMGGTIRTSDPAICVHALGDRVNEVECASGWRERFDAVASNADIMQTYRRLLSGTARGEQMAGKLGRKRFSPSLFVVHFGVEGSWPGIPHNMVLFGQRYEAWLADVYQHGVLPQDMMIILRHPSVTDPSVAPSGKSTFQAAVPVAHLGKLPIDWDEAGPLLEKRVLDEVGRRLIPDIHDRIVTSFHYAPDDFENDLGAYHGSAYGLEPVFSQVGPFRPGNRDGQLKNFYLVGASTHPGAGVPAVIASAKVTAQLMLEDLV